MKRVVLGSAVLLRVEDCNTLDGGGRDVELAGEKNQGEDDDN